MHKPHEEMSDDELVAEWELTHADKISVPPGQEPPAHAYDFAVRHEHAAAELRRRGYEETEDGWAMTVSEHSPARPVPSPPDNAWELRVLHPEDGSP